MGDLSFGIKTSRDFFQKLEADYEEFQKDKVSSRLAINCAMTAWHIIEWLYREEHPDVASRKVENDRLKEFRDPFLVACSDLKVMNHITDGSKHCILSRDKNILGTDLHGGGFSSGFNRGFDMSCLTVKIDEHRTEHFEDVLERVVSYWRSYFSSPLQDNNPAQ